LAEVDAYKADAAMKIAKSEEKIKEYNADMNVKKTKALESTVDELQKKIVDLKQKIANLNANDRKETWGEFKTEFDHDMDEIGKALKDITVNDTKK
jgi:DNA-binding transcriptional MerR regulator